MTTPTIEPRTPRSRIPLTDRYTNSIISLCNITILVCWHACFPTTRPPSSKLNVLNTKKCSIINIRISLLLQKFKFISRSIDKHSPSFVCLLHSSQSPSCLVIFKRADASFSWGDVIVTSLEHSLNYNVRFRLLTRTNCSVNVRMCPVRAAISAY